MTTETVKIDMTWKDAAAIIAAALEDGTGEGKAKAREELFNMAAQLDNAIAFIHESQQMKKGARILLETLINDTGETPRLNTALDSDDMAQSISTAILTLRD